jgi:hypothetical protein
VSAPFDRRRRAFFTAFWGLTLMGLGLKAGESSSSPLTAAQRDAHEVFTLLAAAVATPDPAHPSLGATLALYAKNTGTEASRYEGLESAARRILADGTTTLGTPESTSQRLSDLAESLQAHVRTLGALRADLQPPDFATVSLGLRATAHLARFHAQRILAAVHYNLFLRGRRLAELYAATLDAKIALDTWSELVALLGTRESITFGHPALTLRGAWGAELVHLQFDYRDLEAMCCPPDESWLHEKVWSPSRKKSAP